jgi:hypothetical protein
MVKQFPGAIVPGSVFTISLLAQERTPRPHYVTHSRARSRAAYGTRFRSHVL